ncbi:MAG TPA: polyprenyl synthetase family protein [Anaeromyxobacteraceae bacterium]|nr:polyprenyl synthetase family protein [Anaeromyxobacteraceae bacterium]
MSREQAVLSQLDASAGRGVRPEKAQTALQEVPSLASELTSLEAELSRATEDAEETLRAAARHLVGSGGKRIRPTVTLLACGACGGAPRHAVPFACAAELTHSATLLHDDVIDDGPTRRGQPASRVLWGNAVSVLSGDWLLTRALEIVAAEPARSAALPALLATMRRLVEGEVLQLSLRGSFEATEQDYFDVVRGKTASLFGWSAAAGAWAAGIRGEVPDALADFGEGIGMAFQLVDDALDYVADPALLGKRLGQDFVEGKATLPLIRAFQREPLLRDRLSALIEGELDGTVVAADVIEAVKRTGGVEAARALAREHTAAAMEALEKVPDGPHRRAMAEAARHLTERAF